jgi:hypothetical protein
MRKEYVVEVLTLVLLSFGMAPASALTLDKPPMLTKKAADVKKVQSIQQKQSEAVNPLYPAKYTQQYINQIKNDYSVVGKDEVFYVALDMLKKYQRRVFKKCHLGK